MTAADRAQQRGATHLLVPAITEWKQMRTDDPIGAFTGSLNRVTVTLRLMRLQPPTLVGHVCFSEPVAPDVESGCSPPSERPVPTAHPYSRLARSIALAPTRLRL
jgi:hypothetical protein